MHAICSISPYSKQGQNLVSIPIEDSVSMNASFQGKDLTQRIQEVFEKVKNTSLLKDKAKRSFTEKNIALFSHVLLHNLNYKQMQIIWEYLKSIADSHKEEHNYKIRSRLKERKVEISGSLVKETIRIFKEKGLGGFPIEYNLGKNLFRRNETSWASGDFVPITSIYKEAKLQLVIQEAEKTLQNPKKWEELLINLKGEGALPFSKVAKQTFTKQNLKNFLFYLTYLKNKQGSFFSQHYLALWEYLLVWEILKDRQAPIEAISFRVKEYLISDVFYLPQDRLTRFQNKGFSMLPLPNVFSAEEKDRNSLIETKLWEKIKEEIKKTIHSSQTIERLLQDRDIHKDLFSEAAKTTFTQENLKTFLLHLLVPKEGFPFFSAFVIWNYLKFQSYTYQAILEEVNNDLFESAKITKPELLGFIQEFKKKGFLMFPLGEITFSEEEATPIVSQASEEEKNSSSLIKKSKQGFAELIDPNFWQQEKEKIKITLVDPKERKRLLKNRDRYKKPFTETAQKTMNQENLKTFLLYLLSPRGDFSFLSALMIWHYLNYQSLFYQKILRKVNKILLEEAKITESYLEKMVQEFREKGFSMFPLEERAFSEEGLTQAIIPKIFEETKSSLSEEIKRSFSNLVDPNFWQKEQMEIKATLLDSKQAEKILAGKGRYKKTLTETAEKTMNQENLKKFLENLYSPGEDFPFLPAFIIWSYITAPSLSFLDLLRKVNKRLVADAKITRPYLEYVAFNFREEGFLMFFLEKKASLKRKREEELVQGAIGEGLMDWDLANQEEFFPSLENPLEETPFEDIVGPLPNHPSLAEDFDPFSWDASTQEDSMNFPQIHFSSTLQF